MINIEEQRLVLSRIGEEMLELCHIQMKHSYEAFASYDNDLAEEVILKENRVNALDLKIERDTDNFIALYNPVATDLRFALALLKMNYNLERIGDQSRDISNYTIELNEKLDSQLIRKLKLQEMFDTLDSMFTDVISAYVEENPKHARKVFKKDKIINKINANAFHIISEDALKNPSLIQQYLVTLLVMKKFEKIGDLLKNISESIIYYVDAKILKHKKGK